MWNWKLGLTEVFKNLGDSLFYKSELDFSLSHWNTIMEFLSSPHFILLFFSFFPFQAIRSLFLEQDLGKLRVPGLSKEWWDVHPLLIPPTLAFLWIQTC